MRIINIIDRFDKVNFGIWNAAIATASMLKEKYDVNSELWYPKTEYGDKPDIKCVPLDLKNDTIQTLINKHQLNAKNDIIITHGCWQYPTRWGHAFKKLGFQWVYVPHGMLEPWSREQKWLQKFIYYQLFEGRYANKANVVRAVGKPEFENLKKLFKNLVLIPNGSHIVENVEKKIQDSSLTFLFMARLHHKKGIIPLIKAWKESALLNNHNYKLIIAGPDDGELGNVKNEIEGNLNIEYIGTIFGNEKKKILQTSHFFILPSFSEGFPTSVVEAMQYGLIPIITEGCNFPEAFEHNLAIKINVDIENIKNTLEEVVKSPDAHLQALSSQNLRFASQHYSLEIIAEKQYKLYTGLLGKQ